MGEATKKEPLVIEATIVEDDGPAIEAKPVNKDAFAAGEKLADELEAAAKKVAPFASKIADRGAEIAGTVRLASGVAREISGHLDEIKSAATDIAAAVEKKGIPIREKLGEWSADVWRVSPGPFSQRG